MSKNSNLFKTPEHIKNWQTSIVSYADYIDKDLIYHLYCNYRGITREIYWTDGMIQRVRANIWDRSGFCGYHPKSKAFIKPQKGDLVWYDYCLKNRPSVNISKSFTNKKQMLKILPTLKYVYPDYWDKGMLFEFMWTLKSYPQLELIYKNEYLKPYWKCRTLYKLNKKELFNLAKFIEVDKRSELSEGNLLQLIYLLKHPNVKTKEQWENIKWLNRSKKVDDYFGGEVKDLAHYLKKQYYTHNMDANYCRINKGNMLNEYNDYLKLCKKLDIYGAWYPRDLMKQIEVLSKKIEAIEEAKRRKLEALPILSKRKFNKYNNKLVHSKQLTLILPNSLKELIAIGNKLHNCVGSSDYDEKIKKGESLIVTANIDKRPVECCEIDLDKMKIAQLYGNHNSSNGKYHNAARLLINRYIREIRA